MPTRKTLFSAASPGTIDSSKIRWSVPPDQLKPQIADGPVFDQFFEPIQPETNGLGSQRRLHFSAGSRIPEASGEATMDHRGLLKIGNEHYITLGGMLAGQEVTDRAVRRSLGNTVARRK